MLDHGAATVGLEVRVADETFCRLTLASADGASRRS